VIRDRPSGTAAQGPERRALHARHGGGPTSIAAHAASPVGTLTGRRPAMPVIERALVE